MPLLLELIGEFEKCAEQGCTIVVQNLDQPCLMQESPKLNELSRAGAPLLHPVACVSAVLSEHESIPEYGQALELSR